MNPASRTSCLPRRDGARHRGVGTPLASCLSLVPVPSPEPDSSFVLQPFLADPLPRRALLPITCSPAPLLSCLGPSGAAPWDRQAPPRLLANPYRLILSVPMSFPKTVRASAFAIMCPASTHSTHFTWQLVLESTDVPVSSKHWRFGPARKAAHVDHVSLHSDYTPALLGKDK